MSYIELNSQFNSPEVGAIIIPILQMRKLYLQTNLKTVFYQL